MYAYYRIYLKFLDYHDVLLEEFKDIYSPREVRLVQHTNSEVRGFFSMIISMLLVQTVFLGSLALEAVTAHKASDRIHAIMTVILNLAYIVLYIGISRSADKSFRASHKLSSDLNNPCFDHLPFFGGKQEFDNDDSVLGEDNKFRPNSIFVDDSSEITAAEAKESLR